MSVQRFNIEFYKVDKPLQRFVTKFGGQPVWIDEPEWPLSRATQHPMRFICQIALTDLDFDEPYDSGMVYLFMTDNDISVNGKLFGAYDQFDPEGGENAVIIQPGDDRIVNTSPLNKGPSLLPKEATYWSGDQAEAYEQSLEYSVSLVSASDPDFIGIDDLMELPDSQHEQYCESLIGSKLAGTPGFIQPDEFPFPSERSQLILQLDAGDVPFNVDFGDVGVGYLFVELGSHRARFLWQCG